MSPADGNSPLCECPSASPCPKEFLLRMQAVTKRFGATLALDQATLDVRPSEVHALLGENGSGKSTLMKILAGIHTPDSGQVILGGESVSFASPHAASRAGIAMVHQELNLVPVLSAAENIFLGQEKRTRLGTLDRSGMLKAARLLFQELEIDVAPSVPVELLPVALRQMVEIARAIAQRSRLLILDEPTSALTDSEVEVLFRLVRRLKSEGTSVIYISHKMAEVFALADRFTVLRDGGTVTSGLISQVSESEIVQSMVGRKLGDYYPARSAASEKSSAREILRVEGLTRPSAHAHSGRKLLENVSFTLSQGEILGISGLVGAGRTELLETLFGVAGSNWSGTITLQGKTIRPTNCAQAISEGIALVTEDRALSGILRQQSVLSNATLAELPRLARFGLVLTSRERQALAEQSETMRIRRASDFSPIESLSGGNQQKVILARWLMTRPKVLLLDEPTRGIDVGAKAEIYRVLRSLADARMGIIFVSSEMPELLGLADRIVVLSAGRVTAEMAVEQASESRLLEAAMAGLSRS